MSFVEKFQLLNPATWQMFVRQFCEKSDYDGGWKGEFWGKMMRGACFVYSYTRNPELYEILRQTVAEMLETEESSGRISTYPEAKEFKGWDMWCRKYVLLGMQYFMEICTDEDFNKKILASMCRQADYITEKIGKAEDGKLPITSASNYWMGLNSSSVLEPVVRLYSLTGNQKYLDFAKHIVECGGTGIANIFNLAYENEFYPYQYPVTKAYEILLSVDTAYRKSFICRCV